MQTRDALGCSQRAAGIAGEPLRGRTSTPHPAGRDVRVLAAGGAGIGVSAGGSREVELESRDHLEWAGSSGLVFSKQTIFVVGW